MNTKMILAHMLRRKTRFGEDHVQLHRVLSREQLIFLGVGLIIGAGIFVSTGRAVHTAGPAAVVSFLIAGCVMMAIAIVYSEMAKRFPHSGSAYTYSYAVLGEIFAWILGWDLQLEYAFGAAAVAAAWSGLFQTALAVFHIELPGYLTSAPENLQWQRVIPLLLLLAVFASIAWFGLSRLSRTKLRFLIPAFIGSVLLLATVLELARSVHSMNLPAVMIIVFVDIILVMGVKETANLTKYIVVLKMTVVLAFIAGGILVLFRHPDTAVFNYHDFAPFGWAGILAATPSGAFAFLGFDGLTTSAEECKDPQRDMRFSIIWSVIISAIAYVAVILVLCGIQNWRNIDLDSPIAEAARLAISPYFGLAIAIGGILGLTSVLLVGLYGQSRIGLRMANDGLTLPVMGRVSASTRTPIHAIVICGACICCLTAFIPGAQLEHMTVVGTLCAFIWVCIARLVLLVRERRVLPITLSGMIPPVLGIMGCAYLLQPIPAVAWQRLIVWMLIGLPIYFFHGRNHSALGKHT
jgi:APA family basic amino acid/polyamine antiporter